MRFSTGAVLLAMAGAAVAQYTVTSTYSPASTNAASGCVQALTDIVNECLETEQPKVDACADNDWSCFCSAQQQVITCFNNCPSDSRAFGAQQQETQWCAAAKSYGKTSSTIHYAQPTKTPTPVHVSSGSHGGSNSGSSNSPSNGDSSDSSGGNNNGAFAMAAPLGGAFAAMLGVVALL